MSQLLEEIDMSDWIDIKEIAPDEGIPVLITNGDIIVTASADYNIFQGKDVIWWDMPEITGHDREWMFDEQSITHWMQLPESPQK